MAKSDSFFVRASLDWNGTTFAQTSIDLGAYVDALGKSVLRIHNVAVMWNDPTDIIAGNPAGAGYDSSAFQITTQSQTSMVDASDKSLITSGCLSVSQGAAPAVLTHAIDVAPQHWNNGYLVGVEQIYLGCDQSFDIGATTISVVMECTVETLSQSAAMALALSQQ